MGPTINELFYKYAEVAGPVLEEDRYFQYLYESIQAADKTIEQKSQVLHKVVDEEWLKIVEDSLDALNTITNNPRRFIVRSEELVPVALAKKITADSVRHLSQNTQFISGDEDGEINPSKILNVTNEDSYDLYENRFVYHLIQRLVTFIDKRTDVIFWSTGDETRNVMRFETQVDDAYEQIEYKVEMKITNRQSFAENDAENMTVFMRIDRVRRMVMALRHSSFCDLMNGCAKVRSPIQRTNLMMKDPDYRTCYALWQFLERYDQVGYSIVEQDRAYEIDEEYLIQLYSQMITSYALFKTLTGEDRRDVDTVIDEKRKFHKPKFIKQIREEYVENRDLPDVEIRRIFVEEVTQAQLDAEAALAEERRTTAELTDQLNEMSCQVETAIARQQDAEAAMQVAEAERNAALEAQQKAEQEAQAAKDDAAIRIADESQKAAARVAAAQEAQRAAELERDDANGAKAAAESLKFAAEKRANEAEEAMQQAVEASEKAIRECDDRIAAAKADADARANAAIADADARAEAAETDFASRAAAAEENAKNRIEAAAAEAEQRASAAEKKADERAQLAEKNAEIRIAGYQNSADEKVAGAREAQAAAEQAKQAAEAARDAAETARKAAEEASSRDAEAREAAESRARADQAARKTAEDENAAAQAAKAEAVDAMEKAVETARADVQKARSDAESLIRSVQEETARLQEEAHRMMAEANARAKEAEERYAQGQEALTRAGEMMSDAQRIARESKQTAEEAVAAQVAAQKAEKKALSRLERETRARVRAQEKAKEGTLSKYIADWLRSRNSQGQDGDGGDENA